MNNYKSMIRCAVAALLLCCTGCTDQWDEHYDDSLGVNGSPTMTLWDQITSSDKPALKNFAEICELTPFRTSEKNKPEGYTFANLLGKPMADGTESNVTLTVFAPVIDDARCAELKAMLQEGREWEVQTQFLSNHIRRNRMDIVGNNSNNKLYMLNTKLYTLDEVAKTMNGVAIVNPNIPATNGVMHVLDSEVPFVPNLHEYLRAIAKTNAFANFIIQGDTAYFEPSLSIEGEPDETTGQVTYVDSVFNITNKYFSFSVKETNKNFSGFFFNGFGLNVSAEDSMYAMIIPSDQAMTNAIDGLKKYYRYAEWYENNDTRNGIKTDSESGYDAIVRSLPSVEDIDNMQLYIDSLQIMMTRSQLLRSLLFNMNAQYQKPTGTQEEVINAFDAWKDNVDPKVGYISTFKDTLRALPYHPDYRVTDYEVNEEGEEVVLGINWDELLSQSNEALSFNPNDIFDGKKPVRMSNGLAYVVDNYNVHPLLNVHTDFLVEAESGIVYQTQLKNSAQQKVKEGPAVHDSIMSVMGRVSNGYVTFGATGTGGVSITFRLPEVLSAKYDIYAVTVPEFYNSGDIFPCSFDAVLSYIGEEGLNEKNNGSMVRMSDQRGKILTNPNRVETHLLFEDFEFPYCYADLPNSYPTLTFVTDKQVGSGKKKETTNNLCIDFIYLKAKE